MQRIRLVVVLALACAAWAGGVAACGRARVEDLPDVVASPSRDDRGELCADVGDIRACWGPDFVGPHCSRGACVVPRPLPESAASASGWRCDGMRSERVCAPRARGAGPFVCDGDQCVQAHPRLPDSGEWDCAELDGAVRCVGGLAASGVPPGPPDRGWLCGVRRGSAEGERVCVDLAPDWPEPAVTGDRDAGDATWRCRFERKLGLVRACKRDASPDRTRLGGPCSEGRACPGGSACVDRRCLPERPAPTCWQDEDCGGAKCRAGTCAVAGS